MIEGCRVLRSWVIDQDVGCVMLTSSRDFACVQLTALRAVLQALLRG